ncbi:NAD(+) synthase [Silvanigrella paludirubra]|uniref:Glutamine-dependent NAD(+) synthetase n=1 Tax=Silvanigrella paludirubra TaxID=2499159 RepID=A0A6N6VV69_9BACT|nr:NAD(+) synthase [Silvanigrella paludirubra]KAB8039659.1 NAD(+) synthase [Silvanigrella paludirubra]
MKIAIGQIRVVSANCIENYESIKIEVEKAIHNAVNLIIFPEMVLPGYLNGDTWEQTSFLKECEYFHFEITKLSHKINIMFGSVGIDWNKKNEDGRVRKYNAVFIASKGKLLENSKTGLPFWIKSLLPNYREFDDSRHFYDLRKLSQEMDCKPIDLYEPAILNIDHKEFHIGLSICEDGWSHDYTFHPIEEFSKRYKHDFFVNLSSSPFTLGKKEKREKLFSSISSNVKVPIFYVNCVGVQNVGKTIYGFDGSSTYYSSNNEIVCIGEFFKSSLAIGQFNSNNKKFILENKINKNENILVKDMQISLEYIIEKCLQEWNINRVVIGASGGIDSALSAVLFSRVLGSENVYLLNMPSKFNSSLTKNAAFKLAENLNCPFASVGITNSIEHTKTQLNEIAFLRSTSVLDISTLVFENIQARDRGGRILSALSASLKGVFSCNANKSELTVGYSTLYGDQAGFLSPIADLWKKDVYELSKFYNNEIYKSEIIPIETIQVVPSAELNENQNVLENKGDPIQYTYHDYLFRSWVEHWDRKTPEDCLKAYLDGTLDSMIGCEEGLSKNLFPTVQSFIIDLERWWLNYKGMGAFKRVQAPPIIAITRRAFGFDHREHIGRSHFSECYMSLKKSLEV